MRLCVNAAVRVAEPKEKIHVEICGKMKRARIIVRYTITV
jgi:hypothetical protein